MIGWLLTCTSVKARLSFSSAMTSWTLALVLRSSRSPQRMKSFSRSRDRAVESFRRLEMGVSCNIGGRMC